MDTKTLLADLSSIGAALADTYSELNQETGDEFISGIETVDNLVTQVNGLGEESLTVAQKDNLLELLKYVRGKLERRNNAIAGNAINA